MRLAEEVFGFALPVERDCDPESPNYCWYNIWVTTTRCTTKYGNCGRGGMSVLQRLN